MVGDENAPGARKRLPLETAHYIADLAAELSLMAQGAGLETLAHLLKQARLEAERVLGDSGIRSG